MSKHTKGPWNIDPKFPTDIQVNGQDLATMIYANNTEKVIPENWNNIEPEQAIANARLIAAAPEMYELLKQISEGNEVNFEYAKASIQSLLKRIDNE